MGTQNGPYKADFPEGSSVRIKPREALDDFLRTWKYHDPIKDFQLKYAGQIAIVRSVGFYFGGDELYTLEGVPGIWNECCLESSDGSPQI